MTSFYNNNKLFYSQKSKKHIDKCVYLPHHVWHTITPRLEQYQCFENDVLTSFSLYQLSDYYLYTIHHFIHCKCHTCLQALHIVFTD